MIKEVLSFILNLINAIRKIQFNSKLDLILTNDKSDDVEKFHCFYQDIKQLDFVEIGYLKAYHNFIGCNFKP